MPGAMLVDAKHNFFLFLRAHLMKFLLDRTNHFCERCRIGLVNECFFLLSFGLFW